MTADMAIELKSSNVSVVSIWPGFSKTELGKRVIESGTAEKVLGITMV